MKSEKNVTEEIAMKATQLIRDYLANRPAASPEEIVHWLGTFGVEVSAERVGAILAAIKTG